MLRIHEPKKLFSRLIRGKSRGFATFVIILVCFLAQALPAVGQCTAPSFAAAVNFPAGDGPGLLAVGDFNGDGTRDLAVPNINANSVTILLGSGAGSFTPGGSYPVGSNPTSVAAGDFNADGKLDLAVVNYTSFGNGDMSILIGTGTGSFGAPTSYRVIAFNNSVMVSDLNNDGKLDIVAGTYSENLGNVKVLLGNGTGSFGAVADFGGNGDGYSAVVGDFNSDGKGDVAIAINSEVGNDFHTGTRISVLLGNGGGGFGAATNFAVGTGPTSIALGDLNADGKLDLAVTNAASDNVSVLLGNGLGGFAAATNFAAPDFPYSVAVGDFNLDSTPDLAVTSASSNIISVLIGNGTGGFSAPNNFAVASNPISVLVSDFNGDNRSDLAVANRTSDNVSILLNTCAGTPNTIQLTAATYNVGEGGGAVNVAVSRTGDITLPAAVNYATSDTAGLNNCSFINSVASARCDYTISVGTTRFSAGETSKNISIPIIDDSFSEGNENFTITLSNASGGTLGALNTATVTVQDNEATNGPNPIEGTAFFVRQQYLDFLNREPDPGGYAAWQAVINGCAPGDISCDRIHVSSAFFRSPEFQQRGYFVYRFYPVSFGRKPDYDEFTPDIAKVSGFLTDVELEAARVSFIAEFMSRPAFVAKFNGLDNTQYVDMLIATAGITHSARDFWIAALGNATRTRAQVLREISEDTEVYNKYYNQAFVVMQYFGYLRRQPDAQYLAWIQVLDSTGDFRGMINGFMNSLEYRARFGP